MRKLGSTNARFLSRELFAKSGFSVRTASFRSKRARFEIPRMYVNAISQRNVFLDTNFYSVIATADYRCARKDCAFTESREQPREYRIREMRVVYALLRGDLHDPADIAEFSLESEN